MQYSNIMVSQQDPMFDRAPVLRPFGHWAGFGVRDPSVLLDAEGSFISERGSYTMYFNARDRPLDQGGVTVVGRASSPDGKHWTPDETPLLRDGMYAAQGSAMSLANGEVLMPYSPDTRAGFKFALAENPWATFKPLVPIILRPADVDCNRVGLPFLSRIGGSWHLVFEGINRRGRFGIYEAWSHDLEVWEPERKPLLSPQLESWDGLGQANPSIHFIAGKRTLLYNGSSLEQTWDVGCAQFKMGRWISVKAPILSRISSESWSSTRLEGARPAPGEEGQLLYFGTPSRDPYAGATIGYAQARGRSPFRNRKLRWPKSRCVSIFAPKID